MRLTISFLGLLIFQFAQTQAIDPWLIKANKIDPSNYYGITVANGMIGIVSSPEPLKVKDVVLAGAYDLYGRGRVSNFLRSFNLLNMYLDIDGSKDRRQECYQHAAGTGYARSEVLLPRLIMLIKRQFPIPIILSAICHILF